MRMDIRHNSESRGPLGPIARIAIVLLLLLAAAPALAAEPAGRVLITQGTVTATNQDGIERALSRNDIVYPGETLRTGPKGHVQVRFRDDALVALKPSTTFEIERYREASAGEGGSAIMRLVRGALRTISGAIGHGEGDEYALQTPVATIGIRGTDYSLEFCDAACAGKGRAPGLYGRVDDGAIIVSTGAGSGPFSSGDYFFVPQGGAPQHIVAPPEGILVDDDDEEESKGEPVSENEIEGVTITEGEGDEGPGNDPLAGGGTSPGVTGPNFEAGENTDPPNLNGAFVAGVFSGHEPDGDVRHGAGLFDPSNPNVSAWMSSDGTLVQVMDDDQAFNSATAKLVESGTLEESDFAVEWGRWSGDFLVDGDEAVTGEMVYAYTQDWTSLSAMEDLSTSSSQLYMATFDASDSVHFSDPSWTLDQFNLTADFAASEITLDDLRLNKDSIDVWFTNPKSTSFVIDGNTFDGELIATGDVDGWGPDYTHPASGEFHGVFIGKTASGILVAIDIELWNDVVGGDLEDTIDGVVILGK